MSRATRSQSHTSFPRSRVGTHTQPSQKQGTHAGAWEVEIPSRSRPRAHVLEWACVPYAQSAFPRRSVGTSGHTAQQGSEIAKNARLELEAKTGKKVVSPLNAQDGMTLNPPENVREDNNE